MAIRLAVATTITVGFLVILGFATGALSNLQLEPLIRALGANI